jgi:hypothetical protein
MDIVCVRKRLVDSCIVSRLKRDGIYYLLYLALEFRLSLAAVYLCLVSLFY